MSGGGNPNHDQRGRFSSGQGGSLPHGGGTHMKTGAHTSDAAMAAPRKWADKKWGKTGDKLSEKQTEKFWNHYRKEIQNDLQRFIASSPK